MLAVLPFHTLCVTDLGQRSTLRLLVQDHGLAFPISHDFINGNSFPAGAVEVLQLGVRIAQQMDRNVLHSERRSQIQASGNLWLVLYYVTVFYT